MNMIGNKNAKIMVNARILKRPYEMLKEDAQKRGLNSAPAMLNHILATLYSGSEEEWVNIYRASKRH